MRFGVCDSVVAIEAFQRRVLVKNRVLRPSGNGIQLPDPDARTCAAVCRHPLLKVPGVHLLLIFNGTVEAPYLNAGSARQSLLVRIPRVTLASASFRHEVHALTGAHGEHFPALLRQRGADFARGGVAKHTRILRTNQEDVAKSRGDFGVLDMMEIGPGLCVLSGVVRRPQVASTLQQSGEIGLVQPGQIDVPAVIRQVVPGNPETSVTRLFSPTSALRRGLGMFTLSVRVLRGDEHQCRAASRLQKIATLPTRLFIMLCHTFSFITIPRNTCIHAMRRTGSPKSKRPSPNGINMSGLS